MKVEKDGHTLEVTEKAYRVVYAPKGYKEAKKTQRKSTKKDDDKE